MKYVGVMTGTSMDGLDVALLETDTSPPAVVAVSTVPLPSELARALARLVVPGDGEIDRLGVADAALGEFIGQSVLDCLASWDIAVTEVRAIGSHGQTVRHRPTADRPFSLQIGDPSRIAEITGIDTVADFRRRDVAAGGQGAPLVPLFHEVLFRNQARHRVVLNIGGIANATMLPAQTSAVTGFDTGPGNALLDAWSRHCRDEPYDRDGAWAAGGQVMAPLLAVLQRDPFVHASPPKSTGKETYHLGYVQRAGQHAMHDHDAIDVQATLAEFTAWSIAFALRRWGPESGDVVVCGGGRHNADLMGRLGRHLDDFDLATSDDLGVDGDALEAAAFAWFAHRTLLGKPSNAPAVTGASGDRVLGAIHTA
ncbi:MAG: anhydro-N-acetylmuramic acid kinase [Gammaproteobacteria bacterium]|nr:anhydro-N-acetylmuramic acid kinase [Gammaproteobacteria bacterium]